MAEPSQRTQRAEQTQRAQHAGGRSEPDDERRRRVAQLLGDVLPEATSDETAAGWGESEPTSRDEDLLRDVPPHYGS